MIKNLSAADIDNLTKDFNEDLRNGDIKFENPEDENEFCLACDNYFAKLRFREYSHLDMEKRTFHKDLCVPDNGLKPES